MLELRNRVRDAASAGASISPGSRDSSVTAATYFGSAGLRTAQGERVPVRAELLSWSDGRRMRWAGRLFLDNRMLDWLRNADGRQFWLQLPDGREATLLARAIRIAPTAHGRVLQALHVQGTSPPPF